MKILLSSPATLGGFKQQSSLTSELLENGEGIGERSGTFATLWKDLINRYGRISFMRMEWLLLKVNILYYTPSKKAIQDVWQQTV